MANRFDLNNRTSRIKVGIAGLDQLDTVSVSVIVVRFIVYLIAATFVHDSTEWIVVSVASTEIAVMILTLVLTFKRDLLVNCVLRILGNVMLAAAGLGVIYVDGVITEYLTNVQKRESVIVLLVFLNILLAVVATVRLVYAMDVLFAATTSRHRKSVAKLFPTRVRVGTQIVGTCLCVVVLVLPAVLAGSIVSSLDTVRVDSKIYQVIDSEYVFYDYPTTVRKQAGGCVLTDKSGAEIKLNDTPLYFGQGDNTERILLPVTYAIVEPAISSTKRVDNLSLISKTNDSFLVSSESGEREASGFFLYDGRNSYIFFEETTLNIGTIMVTVSPFSYITASYNGALTIFDPKLASCSTYSLIGRDAYAVMKDGTKIDVGMDILIKTDGVEQMLFMQPTSLSEYVG